MSAPSPAQRPFLEFLRDGIARGGFESEDVLAALLPLMEQTESTHAAGFVAPLAGTAGLFASETHLFFEDSHRQPPRHNAARLDSLERPESQAVDIVGRARRTADVAGDAAGDAAVRVENLAVAQADAPIDRPVYLPGYRCWEQAVDHHDALTDIFSLGLVLASVACGLELDDAADVRVFVENRDNLFAVNARLHPVLAALIVQMTELERRRRAQDLHTIILRLRNYRQQSADLDFDVSRIRGFRESNPDGKRQLIQKHLRDRLFEVSRRNRLLYFKPTLGTLNLTLASVPLMLDYRNIRPERLFTWHADLAARLSRGGALALGDYLRYEDAPYIPGVLDTIIGEARRDRAEFGFAQLRLVLVFLRWNNLKEAPEERIHSPLLLLPVELAKKKGVRDVYTLTPIGAEAEVNPALRHHLRQLYGLNLPERIDLQETTCDAFFEVLQQQIQASEPGVTLVKVEKPQIRLIHDRARQRLDQYRRRLRLSGREVQSFENVDYSYQPGNFQPLGLQLFLRKVRPSPAPFGEAIREKPAPRLPQIVAARNEAEAGVSQVERQMYALSDTDDTNRYRWQFDLCNLTLGNFNYRKMSLVRDYTTLLESEADSAAFDTIFSLEPRAGDDATAPVIPLDDLRLVVPCDPTQNSAIARARSGGSYIIQGPPGTGKSQTITNLIADYVARGKRVLFVCEKRAAIDVVYFRLRQQGLDELCCLIHDSQTDKREFILDLKQTYEAFLKETDDLRRAAARRDELALLLRRDLEALRRFADAMRNVFAPAGVPLLRMLQRLVELRPHAPTLDPLEAEQVPEYRLWLECADLVRRLASALTDVGVEPVFARQPLRQLKREIARDDNPLAAILRRMETAEGMLRHVAATLESPAVAAVLRAELAGTSAPPAAGGEPKGPARVADIVALTAFAEQIGKLAGWDLLDLLNADSDRARAFARQARALSQRDAALRKAREKTRNWRDKLPEDEVAAALSRAESFAGSLLRFLRPDFWRLRKVLRARYDFDKHAVRPTPVTVLRDLAAEYACGAARDETLAGAREEFGMDDMEECLALVSAVRDSAATRPPAARALQEHLARCPRDTACVQALSGLAPAARELDATLASFLADHEDRPFFELPEELRSIRANLDLLPEIMPILRDMQDVPEKVWQALRRLPLTPEQLEAAMAQRTLQEIYRGDRFLPSFEGRALARRLERMEKRYRKWMGANAESIREDVRRTFTEHVRLSAAPAAQLSEEQKEFKRVYARGRRELEHEFAKTMRYRSIRDLADDETGVVLRDLKPIWLMSPLSVSDTIPLKSTEFDVVIFDEASQIPLEEAVPAVFRSNQAIVVGDAMQLPPTNFFSASRAEEDSLLVEEEGRTIELDLSAESFLTMASRNLPSTMLGWHYRSRYEALISFSNASFYRGRLLTIPDRQLPAPARVEIRVADPAQGAAHAAELLARSVSLHFVEQGIYEKRCNAKEAAYIAQLVRALLARETGKSLGIVAFSEAQQGELEAALGELAREDDSFRNRLEAEYEREVDGQFCGLFVKNLENVQGDERDIVILSICYGYDRDRRMLMNFGPINQRGGEKRLNVIFSRARHHMAVVSSIRPTDITNDYNDGANCLRNFLAYAVAVSEGDAATAARLLATLAELRESRAPRQLRDATVEELAAELVRRGHRVDTHVGQSHFRCDLAVRHATDNVYGLGVLVDTEEVYRDVDPLERFLLRPAILRTFGWQVLLVLTKDWYHDREAVLRQIERALRAGPDEANGRDPVEQEGVGAEAEVPAAPDAEDGRTAAP